MNKNPLKLLLIPLIIAALYFIVQSFFLVNQFGISSVVEDAPLNYEKTNQQDAHILKGQKTRATFKASDNNLGILFVPLVKFGQGGGDAAFRIKGEEEDLPAGRQEKWYHESIFRGDQVQNNQYFPLGFPPISDSKNNKYVFEIESMTGSYQSGIGVIKDKPAMLLYKYSIRDLTDFKTLWSFVSKKFIYVLKNIHYAQLAAVFVISYLFVFFIRKARLTTAKTVNFLLNYKANSKKVSRWIMRRANSNYRLQKKKIPYFTKQVNKIFVSTKIYILFNTNWKKKLIISLLIFLLAFTFRFSASLVSYESLFYNTLGGQGDYDQFIRAATCAVSEFCPAILHQNLLVESTILGIFYEVFGFIGGLKTYLYFMLILSSIVATLPYLLLSRKSWISIGGIIGSLVLATSDFLTNVALSFPPDNGSVFTFSIFFIVYLLTLHIGTIRWILFFGFMGTLDGFNKALFLINDLAAFLLFVPVFLLEKAKRIRIFPFIKLSPKLILYSLIPLLIFLVIYSSWEYFVYAKWTARYFLGGLIETRGANYLYWTSLGEGSSGGNILLTLFYLSVSTIVMVKRLVEYMDVPTVFLASILLGLLYITFRKKEFRLKRIVLTLIFSVATIALLASVKNNYFGIHEIYPGEYIITNWLNETYIKTFLFLQIIFFFALNFKYQSIRLSLPIIPYVVMLILLTENSPFPRISTHVVVWSVILFAFLIDFLAMNVNKSPLLKNRGSVILAVIFLLIFISIYIYPKTEAMYAQLQSGLAKRASETKYLEWVDRELPSNAIVLGGRNDDLITVAENVRKPVVYSTFYTAAVFIPEDRNYKNVKVNPAEFRIIEHLRDENNFRKIKHIILEENIDAWRKRVSLGDEIIFSTSSAQLLHPGKYEIGIYKFNSTIDKGIYELKLKK